MSVPTDAVDPEAVRRRLERLDAVPGVPRLLDRIMTALDQPDTGLAEAAALIESDPLLGSRLLRLANSAFYGVSGRIESSVQALTLLGAAVTRALLFSTAVLDLRIDLRGFWEHCTGTAIAAGALARQLGLPRPEEVSAAGLLHDVGKVVLRHEAPEAFSAVVALAEREHLRFAEAERALLGTDHTQVGARLLERWRLPPRLLEPVVLHHRPEQAQSAPAETAVVHVADTLVHAYGYGFAGDRRLPVVSAAAWKRLGLGPAELDRLIGRFESDLDRAQHGDD